MRRYKITFCAFLIALAGAQTASAQEGAAFLKIGYGARAVAMGNTYTALADDSDALYWNPGALALTGKTEVGMTRAQMFLGDTYDAVSVAVPLGSHMVEDRKSMGYRRTATAVYNRPRSLGVIGFGFARLGHAEQQGRNANRQATGDFGASDMAFSMAYSRPLFRGMFAGLTLKRVQSRIADRSAGTTAADMGLVHHFGGARSFRLGLALRNMGPGLKFDNETSELPLNAALGAAVETMPGLLLATEIQVRPHSDTIVWSVGTEYSVMPALSIRGGYVQKQLSAAGGAEALGSFGGGIGLKWNKLLVDYSVTPFGALGSMQRLSLRTKF